MIAYHFPPLAFGAGVERTLSFVRHLPALGWEPLVLSVDVRGYDAVDPHSLKQVPANLQVRRAFTLDVKRDLSICGHYPQWTALPDRWVSWQLDGVRTGRRMLRDFAPQVIWSTYPIATAHLIATGLQQSSGLPWIADFRDPMLQDDYPAHPALRRSFRTIERNVIGRARFCTFTSPSAVRTYQKRYPDRADRAILLENGYEEESFASLANAHAGTPTGADRPLLLLHSGVVYPSERDPSRLFEALARLARAGSIGPEHLRIRFRASHHDTLLRRLAAANRVEAWIETLPAIAHQAALQEMMEADALLIMQGANCNEQIPSKLYEYLRAGRPILALTDPAGDTANALQRMGVESVVRLDSAIEIEAGLRTFVARLRRQGEPIPDTVAVASATRGERARVLAQLLEQASGNVGAHS